MDQIEIMDKQVAEVVEVETTTIITTLEAIQEAAVAVEEDRPCWPSSYKNVGTPKQDF